MELLGMELNGLDGHTAGLILLEKLVGTRTRQMQRKLKDVTMLSEEEAGNVLELE